MFFPLFHNIFIIITELQQKGKNSAA